MTARKAVSYTHLDVYKRQRLGLKTFVKGFEKATLTGEEEAGRTLEEGIQIAKLLESYGYDCPVSYTHLSIQPCLVTAYAWTALAIKSLSRPLYTTLSQ